MKIKAFLISFEIIIKGLLASFIFITMGIVGALSVQGGDRLQTEYPNMFDSLGGWWVIHFFVGSYLILWICITIWIVFIGREKQIYEQIKKLGKKNAETA